MAHRIFFFGRRVGKCRRPTVGAEYRVVTESGLSRRSGRDFSVDYAFEHMLLPAHYQTYGGAEPCTSVVLALEFFKQQGGIGRRIMTGSRGESCRMYTRGAVKGLNFQPGVVGKTVAAIPGGYITRLYAGISFECVAILDRKSVV